jgi:hypothetical protein
LVALVVTDRPVGACCPGASAVGRAVPSAPRRSEDARNVSVCSTSPGVLGTARPDPTSRGCLKIPSVMTGFTGARAEAGRLRFSVLASAEPCLIV